MGQYTVWMFRNVRGDDTRIVVRCAEPDDMKYQHEYQRVLWRGLANSRMDAYNKYSKQQ